MAETPIRSTPTLPYKSVAAALIFSVFFGPIGLLYASFWGGFIMTFTALVVFAAKLFYPILLLWIFSCIWAVAAVERHNRSILQMALGI